MNTLITPETKQLLFDKGWRYELSESYDPELGGTRVNHSLGEQRWNEGKDLTYVDITIAEVVMWLYEKHGIWINVGGDCDYKFKFEIHTWKWYQPEETYRLGHTVLGKTFWDTSSEPFDSPTEAYGAAIEYVLKNLI